MIIIIMSIAREAINTVGISLAERLVAQQDAHLQ